MRASLTAFSPLFSLFLPLRLVGSFLLTRLPSIPGICPPLSVPPPLVLALQGPGGKGLWSGEVFTFSSPAPSPGGGEVFLKHGSDYVIFC